MDFDPDRQLLELISWQFATELLRRHPESFDLIEAHPSGGQSDCIGLVSPDGNLFAAFNRPGSFAVFNRLDKTPVDGMAAMRDLWYRLTVFDADQKATLEEAEKMMGLRAPLQLPPTTRKVLSFRIMARFLRLTAYSLEVREWRNGFLDTAGFGGGPKSNWFDKFPQLRERFQEDRPLDATSSPIYHYWFLSDEKWGQTDEPLVCIEVSGRIHYRDGVSKDLMKIYQQSGNDLNLTMLRTLSKFAPKT